MRTIYVVLASKHYDTSPKVLRAFDTQAEADGLKELIESCSPSRQIEVVPTQLCGEPVLPTPFPDLLRDPPPLPPPSSLFSQNATGTRHGLQGLWKMPKSA